MVEKIRGGGGGGYSQHYLKCQLLTILDYQTCYQMKVETLHFNPIVCYTNDLIYIFMNINEKIRNKRKMYVQHNPYISC